MSDFYALFVLLVYIFLTVAVLARGGAIRKMFPRLSDDIHLLSGLTVVFTLLIFSFEYINNEENEVTSKQSNTLNYLTTIEDQSVFRAKQESVIMLQVSLKYRDNPLKKFKSEHLGVTGGFDSLYFTYLDRNAAILSQYRARIRLCLDNELCDEEITESYVCPSMRSYYYTVITHRQRFYQKCIKPNYPDLVSISIDKDYEYFMGFCSIEHDKISLLSQDFLDKVDERICNI